MSLQYLTAAKLVTAAESGKSLKAVCAAMPKLRKVDYALAMQTLKFLPVLKEIMTTCEVSAEKLDVQAGLLYVMSYELVFGNGKIEGGGAVKRKIIEHKDAFLQVRHELMKGKEKYEELLSESMQEASSLPLYVRVNEAKMSVAEGLQHLLHYDDSASVDKLIPSLIQMTPQCKGVAQDGLIKEGKLVIQDKASCFPAQILFHEFLHRHKDNNTTCDFIDACAAPGNKTSHLAALLFHQSQVSGKSCKSKVMAFDKSPRRAKIIKDRIKLFGLTNTVSVANQDFLTVDVTQPKYASVQYLLLDPSCSGSGIVRNIERMLDQGKETNVADNDHDSDGEENNESNRLLNLQSFQISVIEKAMSFPFAESIVYSTCSIHNEENEEVVVKVLTSDIGQDWELASPIGFEKWSRRGLVIDGINKAQAKMMIRCAPSDGTNGFFVALFRKKASAVRNQVQHQAADVDVDYNDDHHEEDEQEEVPKAKKQKTSNCSTPAPISNTSNVKPPSEKIKKEKQPSNSNAANSLFGNRFKVSASKKRKFGRR